jgi:hypothetical protein
MAWPGSTEPDLLEFDLEALFAAYPEARLLAEYLEQHPEECRALSPDDWDLITARIVYDQRMPKPPKSSSVGELAAWYIQRERWAQRAAAVTAATLHPWSVRVSALIRVRPVRRLSVRARRTRRTLRCAPSRGSPGREADDGPEPGPRPRGFPNKLILLLWGAYVRPAGVWVEQPATLERPPVELEERAA